MTLTFADHLNTGTSIRTAQNGRNFGRQRTLLKGARSYLKQLVVATSTSNASEPTDVIRVAGGAWGPYLDPPIG